MKFETAKAYINLKWMDILVVTTETEQDFHNVSFTEKREAGGQIYVTTYIVRPSIWKHYLPGHDASDPDAHKYMFIIAESHTDVYENEALVEYGEALNILGVETEEEVIDNA